jgi:hypothetical protein
MVRDAHDAIADESELAPRMLLRPAEAPPALEHTGASASMVTLRRIRSERQHGVPGSLRAWAARISGRSDRRLLVALADATETLATQCDLLVDRVTSQEAVTADVTDAFGRELTLLRAEVAHVRRMLAQPADPTS